MDKIHIGFFYYKSFAKFLKVCYADKALIWILNNSKV